jgi:hypothetical protein
MKKLLQIFIACSIIISMTPTSSTTAFHPTYVSKSNPHSIAICLAGVIFTCAGAYTIALNESELKRTCVGIPLTTAGIALLYSSLFFLIKKITLTVRKKVLTI